MSNSESRRLEPVRCPHCDEVTMPNLLADGSYVCSCTAERALPLDTARGTPWDGTEGIMPAPMDDPSFAGASGPQEHAMPPGEAAQQGTGTPEEQRAERQALPEDKGQFGRDVATEDHKPRRGPPARGGRGDPG